MGAISAAILAPCQTWSDLSAIWTEKSLHVGRWTGMLLSWHEGSTEPFHGGSYSRLVWARTASTTECRQDASIESTGASMRSAGQGSRSTAVGWPLYSPFPIPSSATKAPPH
jgi:hypothetical protein